MRDHQHHLRVCVEAIGQIFLTDTHVLLADFLANNQERNRRKGMMQLTHDLAQDGGIAHASVEHPHRWWHRLQMFDLHAHALSNDPLLTAGRDKKEVLLAVVEKPERPCYRIMVHGIVPFVWMHSVYMVIAQPVHKSNAVTP